MNSFLAQMRNLGPARLATMGGLALGLLGFIIFIAVRFSSPQMELLYGNMDQPTAKRVVQALEERNVPFQLADGGATVQVPGADVLKMRVELSELAAGSNVSLGYELFDTMDSLGTTNFMQQVNLVRALEGELSRTIMAMAGVKGARVHLVMPKREMFSREVLEPSASVVIGMEAGRLKPAQVVSIQQLVAAAVPRLEPSKISVVDDRGTLLARTFEDDGQMMATTHEEMRLAQESRLARSVEALLEQSLGAGKVRAEVNVAMNFDRIVVNEEIYDPEGQVVRSTVTVEEQNSSEDKEPDPVTVEGNLPDADFGAEGATSRSTEQRTEETTNFEVSRRVVNQIREPGQVDRISVAVLVDGIYERNADGMMEYQPRTQEQMDQLGQLVRAAIGYDADRGDEVTITNLPFFAAEQVEDLGPDIVFLWFTKDELVRMAEGLGVALVAILVILLVVRPLITRAFESLPAGGPRLSTAGAEMAALGGPGGAPPVPVEDESLVEEYDADELIDIEKVEGRVKASSFRKIGEIVEKHPDEALSIVRNWLYQGS